MSAAIIRKLPAGRYRTINRICRRPPPAFLMRMPSEIGGHSFQCDLRDSISREVCFTGRYEPQETAVVQSVLGPGMTFVDVGANWGYFTLLAASLVGATGRVLSLEPDPRLFPVLRDNIERAGLGQVTALPVAAADKAATVNLAGYDSDEENFGVSRIVTEPSNHDNNFEVTALSLDEILTSEQLASVDLMKMDIEGAEALAIPGMTSALAAGKIHRLLLELHPRELIEHKSTTAAIVAELQGYGYQGWTIDHSPETFRRAAYARRIEVGAFLKPFSSSGNYDAWPHQLWTAPGIETP